MSEFKQYQRTAVAEMADWTPDFWMAGVSISEADRAAGSPKLGDKIARNPANHDDKWLVAADYFAANFTPVVEQEFGAFTQDDPKVLRHAAMNLFIHNYKGSPQQARAVWENNDPRQHEFWEQRVLKEQQKLIDMSPAEREMRRRVERKEMLDKNDSLINQEPV